MSSFIEQALVFIGSALILVPLFQRLKFGSVLGYLMAGVLVGPFGLGLIRDAESVMHFAELGVVLLLFIIGLEIQPRKLWSMRRHLLGLGGVQILVSSLLFFAIGVVSGLPVVTAGVVGFAMSLSSTAYALQTLSERNQLNTEFGRSSFSILLMQDLVAIPALAFIPNLSSTASQSISWGSVLSGGALIVSALVAGRLLIRPAFRFIAASRAREMFTAAALFVVLGVAFVMQKAGLSAALGAFIAGVLLADSEYRHELEADIEPFKSLLMGLFFIAVGMGVQVGMLAAEPFTFLGMALAYLLLKAVVIYLTGRLFSLSHENAKMTGISVAQGGEFAFVIFGLALQFQLASPELLNQGIAVISLSMALNPLLSAANSRLVAWRCKAEITPQYDEISNEAPQVIIAGFGRFGQIFGRILRAQDIPFVAIDHDSEQVELVRRFGSRVYYGDASRKDLLEAAGAARAKFFILAIDDVDVSLQAARVVTENFPNLQIFARARNRGHAYDLMGAGVKTIKRETIDSSINFVGELLVGLGFSQDRATRLIEKFRRHDEIMLQEQFKVRHDDQSMLSLSKQGVAQLAQVFNEDNLRTYVDSPVDSNSNSPSA